MQTGAIKTDIYTTAAVALQVGESDLFDWTAGLQRE